jgi:hypothetical protein
MISKKGLLASILLSLLFATSIPACGSASSSEPGSGNNQNVNLSPASEQDQQKNIQFAQFAGKYQADPNQLDEVINEFLIQSIKDTYYNPGGPSYVMHQQFGTLEQNDEILVYIYFVFRNCFIENEALDFSGGSNPALVTLKQDKDGAFLPQKLEIPQGGSEFEQSLATLFPEPYYTQCRDYMSGEDSTKLLQQITVRMQKAYERYQEESLRDRN